MNGDAPAAALRLSPDMVSLRLQVLKFARVYIGMWGEGPSYGEIGQATGASRTAVKKAVRKLAEQGLLLRTPGARGLVLPEARDDALRVLRDLGWTVDADHARIVAPAEGGVTNRALQAVAVLDYDGRRLMVGGMRGDGEEKGKVTPKGSGRNRG
ncbi:LexA family transcriptional regulator [Novosphingobium sp. FSW06-99]|uniref:LexA family protein n=1 Tax=Novosphingobium sp. FSW06-99 TaxID=1739113 RepID=UPI00076DE0FA|nr:hypothetical protein [Novosphingobium sp. FSW06-99]KUR80775.1 hypothetical protein AQZ49_01740 [Novosphingobium sp. FSW06-99]